MIKQAKTPDEINKLKAETERAIAAGKLDDAQRDTLVKLIDAKKIAAEKGNIKLQQEIDSMLNMLFPKAGGKPGEKVSAPVPAKDIAEFMTRIEVAGIGAEGRGDLAREKFDTEKEQTAVDIEKVIREKPKGAEALSRYQDFNKYSNRDLIAVNNGGKVVLLQLPKVIPKDATTPPKIITAKMVYEGAKKYNISVEQYLTDVLKIPEAIKMFKR
jgi:hypothetical protein